MSIRLSRAEQNDRNRALLFAAARRVFLARGYQVEALDRDPLTGKARRFIPLGLLASATSGST
jgi:hypothetical protein